MPTIEMVFVDPEAFSDKERKIAEDDVRGHLFLFYRKLNNRYLCLVRNCQELPDRIIIFYKAIVNQVNGINNVCHFLPDKK